MKIGTKSILYGVHAFWLHPWFVALAWWKLFGFPWDPRLWVAFFVHDFGYWGKSNMDGPEGESHVCLGANIMHKFGTDWWWLCLSHSRFWAKNNNVRVSSLCVADKWAMIITPTWLYLLMARATGEIREYRTAKKHIEDHGIQIYGTKWADDRQWSDDLRNHMIWWTATRLNIKDYDPFPRLIHTNKTVPKKYWVQRGGY